LFQNSIDHDLEIDEKYWKKGCYNIILSKDGDKKIGTNKELTKKQESERTKILLNFAHKPNLFSATH